MVLFSLTLFFNIVIIAEWLNKHDYCFEYKKAEVLISHIDQVTNLNECQSASSCHLSSNKLL